MRNSPARRRIRLLSVLALAVSAPWANLCAIAEEPTAPPKKEEKKETKFSPEIEAKLAELFRKVAEAKRKSWAVRMKKELEDVQKAATLSKDEVKALQTGAEQAIERSAEDLSGKMDSSFRQEANQVPGQLLTMLDQALLQVDAMAAQAGVPGVVEPVDQPVWAAALEHTLTVEQAAAWSKVLADRKEAVARETGDLLKGMKERIREQCEHGIAGKVSDIEQGLAPFPKERSEQLNALATQAVNKAVEVWQKNAETFLLSMSPAQRKQMMGRGGLYLGRPEDALPERQTVWTEGLGKILSAEEQKKLQSAQDEHKQRRIRIMAQVMVTLLDEKIAFTGKQRQQLQPIAERLVKDEATLFPENDSNSYNNFPSGIFFVAGSKATAGELEPILDRAQWKHWQESCTATAAEAIDGDEVAAAKLEETKGSAAARTPEPEDVERGISDFLQDLTVLERTRNLGTMILKAEDAARVAQLSSAAIGRLQTAARGAAERCLQNWKTNSDQMVRSNLTDVTPQNVKQRLAAMQGQYSFRQGGTGPAEQPVWEKTVKAEMTEEQQAAWKKEVDARQQYSEKAVTSVIMEEFDRRNSLKPGQWEKLEPLVAKVVIEYSPDIQNYFSYNNGAPWYLQYFSKFIPIAAVPEKEIKAILSKEQWEHWTGSNEYGNSNNYWDNLKRNHEQRVKAKQR